MIAKFLNWQSALLTSKVDGEMPLEEIFMRKLHPEKCSQRLQDLSKYLDYIPIERTTMTYKTKKAYGKSLSDEEIRSIMGRAIPPEWTVNLLALGKEPWRFKDLEDQLNMYRQQWQADQQNQIIAKMVGNMPGKSNDGNRKNNEKNHHNNNCGCSGSRSGGRQVNNGRGGRGGCGRSRGGQCGRSSNNSEHLKTIECFNCGKKGHYSH
jgi:hypothetical protein